jgi:hypothetical protein
VRLQVSIPAQALTLTDDAGAALRAYPVSTAAKGAGELSGSNCTPRGRHIVRAKIGAGAPPNTVFVGRRPTGEIWTPELAARYPDRDWILTRILWLSGCEVGFNRLGDVDTMRRYIYIHGTPDTMEMGKPGSIGCIRMRNAHLVELFDLVPAGTPVEVSAALLALDPRRPDPRHEWRQIAQIFAVDELEVGGVGAQLAEHRVDCDPLAVDQALVPGVIREALELLGVHETVRDARRDAARTSEGSEQVGVALAFGASGRQHIQGGEHVRGLLADVPPDPVEHGLDLLPSGRLARDDRRCKVANPGIGAGHGD